MTGGVAGLLRAWAESAEQWAARVPELAALGAGSWTLAALAAAVGIVLLVAGVRLGRVLSGAAGAALGAAAAGALSGPAARVGVPPSAVTWVAAVLVGAAAAAVPAVYPALLGAIPGALLGQQVPVAGQPWLGAAGGAALLGLVAVVLRRLVLAATAAGAGAVLLAAAVLALAPRVPVLRPLVGRPVLLAAVGAVLAVAGTAFQLERGRGAGSSAGGGNRREPSRP